MADTDMSRLREADQARVSVTPQAVDSSIGSLSLVSGISNGTAVFGRPRRTMPVSPNFIDDDGVQAEAESDDDLGNQSPLLITPHLDSRWLKHLLKKR